MIAALTLVAIKQWPSGVGVFLGATAAYWLMSRTFRNVRKPLPETQRSPGMFIWAGTQAMTGLIIGFVGILIGGSVVLFFTALVGTWMLSAAAFIAAISIWMRSARSGR